MRTISSSVSTALLFAVCALGCGGCGENAKGEGTLEQGGKAADKAADKTGEVIKDGAEKTGDAVKEGAQKTGEAAEKAGEKAKDATK